MKKIIIVFFLLCTILSFSQEKLNYQINIYTNGGISKSKLNIDILRETDSVKIYYKKLIGRDTIALNRDNETILKLCRKIIKIEDNDIYRLKLKELGVLIDKYDIYKKDSLFFEISKKIPFTSLIDSVYSANQDILKNKNQNKYRIVLDGTYYSINVIAKGVKIKSFWVHSPTIKSHPLITKLIRNSLNIYTESNPNSFLEKKHLITY